MKMGTQRCRNVCVVLLAVLIVSLLLLCTVPAGLCLGAAGGRSGSRGASVDLSPFRNYSSSPPAIESLIKTVGPGGSAAYNITVKNLGNQTDRINLSVEGVPPGWKACLDTPFHMGNPNPDYVWLDAGWSVNITLSVTSPWEGGYADTAYVNVTGTSQSDPGNRDWISTITFVKKGYALDVSFWKETDHSPGYPYEGYKWDKLSPGAEAVYSLWVSNTGNCNDTYELTMDPLPPGWSAAFLDSGTNTTRVSLLTPRLEWYFNDPVRACLNIKVKAPEYALQDEEVYLWVRGVSLGSLEAGVPAVEDQDVLLLVAGTVNGIEIGCEDVQKTAPPGEVVNFTFWVRNLCNHDIDVVYSYEGMLAEWKIDIPDERPIPYGQTAVLNVWVTCPPDAPAGEASVITLTAKISGYSHIMDTITFTTIIGNKHDIHLEVLEENRTIDPGEEAVFELCLVNAGNCRELVDLRSVKEYDGMDVAFYKDDVRVAWLDVLRCSRMNFTMVVETPEGILGGEYPMMAMAWGTDCGCSADMVLFVNRTYDIAVTPYSGIESGSTDPQRRCVEMTGGDRTDAEVKVVNRGQFTDTVVLRFYGRYEGWGAEFMSVRLAPESPGTTISEDFHLTLDLTGLTPRESFTAHPGTGDMNLTLVLAPEQSAWVRVRFQSPEEARPDTVRCISVLGDSLGAHWDDPDDNRASFLIKILYPDLKVMGQIGILTPRGYLHENETAAVIVTIKNVGDWPAGGFNVVLLLDGREIARSTVHGLGVSEERTIEFSYRPGRGDEELMVEIDPENSVLPPDHICYSAREVDVDPGPAPPSGEKDAGSSPPYLYVLFGALMLGVVLLGVWTYLRKDSFEVRKG